MISLTILCGVFVLVSSIILFSLEINNAVYDKVNVAMNIVENEIEEIKLKAYIAARGMANNPDIRNAFFNNDRDGLVRTAVNLVDLLRVDYCTILDSTGRVIIRTHSRENFGDSIADLPQIKSALNGRTEAHIIRGPIVRLGVSGGTPIYDDDNNLIGVVSLGFRLDTQDFSNKLKRLTGCEITLFMNDERVSSTVLNYDGTYVLGTTASPDISGKVLNGSTYTGRMNLFGKDILAIYAPLSGLDNEIVGMLFVGYYTAEDSKKVLTLTIYGALITLAILAVCVVLAALNIGFIEKRLEKLMKTIEHRDNMLQSVNQAVGLLLSINVETFDSSLLKAMGMVAESVKADRMYIWKNHIMNGELYCSQIYEWSGTVEPKQDTEYTVNISYKDSFPGELEKIMPNGECINTFVSDLPDLIRSRLDSQGVLSIIMAPIFIENEYWGFIGFDDCQRRLKFTKEEEDILRSCGLLFANAVIRNEMEKKIAETNNYNNILYGNAPIGIATFDKNFDYINCNNKMLEMFGISDNHYGNFISEYSPEYQPDGMRSEDKALEFNRNTLENGENQTFEWMHKNAHGDLLPCEITITRTKNKDKTVGLSYIYDLRRVKDMETKITQLEVEAVKIYYDPLTGIYNRRYFDENLNKIMKSLSRSSGILSLMMIDIDFFKKYNDTYGHSEGDTCLRKVAEALAKNIPREDDFAARYGGEEFAVVLPFTNADGARLVAEKLINNIRALKIKHENSDIADYVTVSIGIITGSVNHNQNENDFIINADKMLYESKQNGRNRFTAASL